jgi:DNA-binding response OmpR family regulator
MNTFSTTQIEQRPGRLLIVDDDESVRARLVDAFELDGYSASGAADLEAARDALSLADFDLLLLDVNLPDGSGYELLREVRAGRVRPAKYSLAALPVVMVSGRGAEHDRIRGFECGCDDYVTKPYSFGELRGRVAAVLRRQGQASVDDVLNLGELKIDPRSRSVTLAGEPIVLTHKEYGLLLALAADPERVFERAHLLETVWGYTGTGRSRTLDAHACRLRWKLSRGRRAYVVNTWGVGYRLYAPEVVRGS